jgi:hypothetical protein
MDSTTVQNWMLAFAGIGLILNLVQRIFGGGWNLSNNLSAVEKRLKEAIDDSKREIEDRQDKAIHDFGETVSALKEHVRQVEFHIRDKYFQKDDFILHMKSHDELLRLNFANITSRLERIEKTLDTKVSKE